MGRIQDNKDTGLHYGNWCGAGWSANQYKDSKDLTYEDFDVEAIDALDQACKNHDIGLRLAKTKEDVARVNGEFDREARRAGIMGTAFAFLVKNFGPDDVGKSFYNLQCSEEARNRRTVGKRQQNLIVYKNVMNVMNNNSN